MTLLQNPSEKTNRGGRKSSWPEYILNRIDELLGSGMGTTEIARRLYVPRNVVQGRKTRLGRDKAEELGLSL